MLVRFLSFTASVLGSARHRAILVSCLAMVFALSSVLGITLMHDGPYTRVASTNARGNAGDTGTENTLWLNGNQFDDRDKVESDKKDKSSQGTGEQVAPDDAPIQENPAPTPTPEMALSTDNITLEAGKGQFTASLANGASTAALTWTITLNGSETSDLTVIYEQTESGAKFIVSALETAQPGNYQIKIYTEVADRDGNTVKLSKTVNVTVPVS